MIAYLIAVAPMITWRTVHIAEIPVQRAAREFNLDDDRSQISNGSSGGAESQYEILIGGFFADDKIHNVAAISAKSALAASIHPSISRTFSGNDGESARCRR